MAQRHDPRAHMRHAHQQTLAFKTVNGFTQRPAADAVSARQFGLGDLAARGDFAFDNGRLNTPEDVLGKGFRVILGDSGGFQCLQHIVDTLKINSAKTSYLQVQSQRINRYCRQSSNTTLVVSTALLAQVERLGAGAIKPSC